MDNKETEELDRIKEEEKEDRLAIAREKKKRYGLKGLNKDEKLHLKRRTEEKKELAVARSNYWKWHRGGEKGGKENGDGPLWESLKEAITKIEKEEKHSTVTTNMTSGAVTIETGQAVTINSEPVTVLNKDTGTSKTVTNIENDFQVTESTQEGDIDNPGRKMSGSILSGRLEEGSKDNLESKQMNEDKENMSGRNLSGSTVAGSLEEGRRIDEGGGVGGRRMGSYGV